MGYSQSAYKAAKQELNARRQNAETAAKKLEENILSKHPEAIVYVNQLRSCPGQIATAILSGGSTEEAIKQIQQKNEDAQQKISDLLAKEGESVKDFSPQYSCSKCNDTGIYQNSFCDCMVQLLQKYTAESFNNTSGMSFENIDDMKLDYYSNEFDEKIGCVPREHMKNIIEYCRCYGLNFSKNADSLLLSGPTGTGKTHAALSIAKMASEKGYNPVYHSAQQIFHQLEKEHFGREDGDSEALLCDCDLLVLDDLGTEMTTSFTISALYSILNTRMLKKLPTIISTNLTPADWQIKYGEAIASRVLGTYQPLLFVGKDIRQQKMKRRLSQY